MNQMIESKDFDENSFAVKICFNLQLKYVLIVIKMCFNEVNDPNLATFMHDSNLFFFECCLSKQRK